MRRIIIALTAGAGALFLAAGILPYALLRRAGDLLARDGSLAILTPALVESLRPVWLLLSAGGLALGLLLRWQPQWLSRWLRPVDLGADLRAFWQGVRALRFSAWEGLGLALAMVSGAYARLALIRAPIHYDEAYTFMAFAMRPVWSILSDYSLPNNHVLHTLLVRAAFLAFGGDVWAIRLPAFLAGLAMIPAAYLAARAQSNRSAALLAAGLVAAWPYLVRYGADARGYSLVGLFTLLLLALAPTLLAKNNLFAWLLFVLLAVLGLFTIPVMAYSLGVLYAWLLLSALLEPVGEFRPAPAPSQRGKRVILEVSTAPCAVETSKPLDGGPSLKGKGRGSGHTATPAKHPRHRRFIQMLIACVLSGLAVLALTALLYAPILLVSGPRALFANPFVRSFSWPEWGELLGVWLTGIYDSWRIDLPTWLFALATLGWLASLLLQPKISRFKVHTSWAAIAFFALALPLQRPEMQAKAFFFLVPLLLIASAAGWAAVFAGLARAVRQPRVVPAAIVLSLLGLAWGIALQARPNLPYLLKGEKGDIEQVAIYLSSRAQPGDAVLTDFPIDPQVWYYGYRHGLGLEYFRVTTYRRAIALVQPGMGQSLEQVLKDRASTLAPIDPADCVLDINLLGTRIYECKPR